MPRLPKRRKLYPPVTLRKKGRLPVATPHELYYEDCGLENGKPVLFVHGGPGGTISPRQRRFFDPARYRIILMDQRGCGKSTPHGCLDRNTTWDLVEDIEELRQHLAIKRWQLFGGSWGATLAIAYAERYPEHVTEMVLRGIFLVRRSEVEWFYQDGASHLFPDAWEEFIAPIAESQRDDLVKAYYQLFTGAENEAQLRAAHAWTTWEKRTSYLEPCREEIEKALTDDKYSLAFARLECHYFMNGAFFDPEDKLLREIDNIRHIPAVVVQGRYDVVCPMTTAWDLHRAWPEADFRIVPTAGHSAFESGIVHELVCATDRYASQQ